MFTGIIEEIGEVIAATREGDGMILSVRASRILSGTVRGGFHLHQRRVPNGHRGQ